MSLLDAVRRAADALRNEPVRARLYAIGASFLAAAVLLGYVSADQYETYVSVLAYVLVTENVRGKVSPAPSDPAGPHTDHIADH